VKADLATLQGKWQVTGLEVDEREMPATGSIVIEGNRFISLGMGAEYSGTIEADFKKKPATLDMVFTGGPEAGARNLGIFELKGDTWKLCLATRGTMRPTRFATKKGSGFALETLRRAAGDAAASPVGKAGATRNDAQGSPAPEFVPAPELEGEWEMLSMSNSGKPLPAAYVKQGKRVARGNRIAVLMAGHAVMEAQFTVDRSQRPHRIDYLLSSGQVQYGIYELNGKFLKAIFASPGAERPVDFESRAGDGRTLSTWKFVKS
jgi:uncharacterized protein (TIGR03067 family)